MSMSMVTSVLSGTSALNIRTCCRRCCLNCFNLHLFLPSTLSSINRGAKRQDKHASFDNKIWYYNMQPHDCPLSARLTQPLADNACVQSSSYMIVSVCLFKTCWIRKLFFFFKPGMLSLQEKCRRHSFKHSTMKYQHDHDREPRNIQEK